MKHGASHPLELVERAASLGQPALGLTDRDGVYGAVKFVLACQKVGISPILGVDLAFSGLLTSSGIPTQRGVARTPARGGAFVDARLPRVSFLAQGAAGWAQVCRLVSAAHTERGNPVLTWEKIEEVMTGNPAIVVLLGPDSLIGSALIHKREQQACTELARWKSLFGSEQLRMELISHRANDRDPRAVSRSTALAARMLRCAVDEHITPVLTNAVRHARPEQGRVVDVLDAARRLVMLDERHLDRVNSNGHLASSQHMAEIAHEIADRAAVGSTQLVANRLLAVTDELARSCVLDLQGDLGLGQAHLPEAPAGVNQVLRQRCEAGLSRRGFTRGDRVVTERLDVELGVIEHLGFASYFLTVADIVEMIRGLGIRVAARGSGAGSLVNHLLDVSGVDPIAHGLLFERFLSPLRVQLPDIDLDVESARRLEIYQHIFDKYGAQRVACVAMTDTYRVRHAIRDVGSALGMESGEISRFAKVFPHIKARDIRSALENIPELREGGFGKSSSRMALVLDLVEELDGLPRHTAMHPCGIVLSNLSLLDRTPVEPSSAGFAMSQFDKDDVEELGLLKLDVLGVRMQSAMSYALDEIERVENVRIELDNGAQVALTDEPTFELIRSTRTLGCFQIESPGQRELLGKFAPETFDDLIIDISLFRPGPVASDMITPFLQARQGWAPAVYLHPDLRPILEATCGVVVFHEQVLRIVSLFAGVSLARADEVRRALGNRDNYPQLRAWFYPAAFDRGYSLVVVEQVWDVLCAFGSFGFCKAHAAAFALPTFQSAWLKTHHPAAFLAGVLTHDPGMYPKRVILDDARQLGIEVLPLDVQASDRVYRVEPVGDGFGIRLALSDVAGISEDEVGRIIQARPYLDLADFFLRAKVSRPVIERLISVGAFDSLHGISLGSLSLGSLSLGPLSPGSVASAQSASITRRDLLLQLADLDQATKTTRSRASTGQLSLVAAIDPASSLVPTGLPEMTSAESVRAELEVLGLDASRHVVDFYSALLDRLNVVRSKDLLTTRSQSHVLVAGVKVSTQTPPVRSGRRVVFLTMDDSTGPVDVAFFDSASAQTLHQVFSGWLLVIRGVTRRTGPKGISIRGLQAWDLTQLYEVYQSEGLGAVLDLLAPEPEVKRYDQRAKSGTMKP